MDFVFTKDTIDSNILHMINQYIKDAYRVLDGEELRKDLALKLSTLCDTDVMDLLSLANKVKEKFNPEFHVCSIANIKSGLCGEDCKYCAQSGHYSTDIQNFPLLSTDKILKHAEIAINSGVKHFGLVSSGKGYTGDSYEFNKILQSVTQIKDHFPNLNICLALGCLDRDAAKQIGGAGIYHYNHNLQVNPEKYSTLVSRTHHIQERVDTIKYLRENNVNVCSGGIFGLGENEADRVELGFALKKLDVSVIPINILVPIEGTPVYNSERLAIFEALKSTAIFRLLHPTKIIKLAAGRETIAKDFQGLFLLSGINGFLTGGYLTTRGRSIEEDIKLKEQISMFQSVRS